MNTKPTKKKRLEIPGFAAVEVRERRNTKLLFCTKNARSHLTVSWNNPTREVDVHLTERTKGDHTNYQTLGPIPEAQLADLMTLFESEMQKTLMNAIRQELIYRVQPDSLEKDGYVVVVLSEQLQEEIKDAIAHKKNEYTPILDMTALKNISQSKSMRGETQPPAILHSLAAQRHTKLILAQRRGRKSHLVFLHLVANQDEEPYWLAMEVQYLEELMRLSRRFMRMLLPESEFARLCNELQSIDLASVR